MIANKKMTTNSFPGFERNIPIFICCDEKIENLEMFESKKVESKKDKSKKS